LLQQGEPRQALDTFHRAVEKDPNFAQAWMAVGSLHLALHNEADGVDEMKRAVALSPNEPIYYKALGGALARMGRLEEALNAWYKVRQISPQDGDAPKQIALILIGVGRVADAIPELELLTATPEGSPFLVQLAVAYAHVGQKGKALETFQQAVRQDSSVASLNTVAYVMTEEHLALDLALQYGEQAVREQESDTVSISLERPTYEDVRGMAELGGDWDTVGWTHFAMNHVDQAEKYLKAAWNLYESPTIGDHLAQVYEKEGKKLEAIQTFAQVVASGNAPEESLQHLTSLEGDAARADREIETARANLARLHDKEVKFHAEEASRAEFFLLFGKGLELIDVKFISGSESLRDAGKAIRSTKFDVLFPDDSPTRIIRRGILACESDSSNCHFLLIPPDAVQSVQ
jgi:tetratricopeptide (TPR) repeat protein